MTERIIEERRGAAGALRAAAGAGGHVGALHEEVGA
jgi:hypothetical protein